MSWFFYLHLCLLPLAHYNLCLSPYFLTINHLYCAFLIEFHDADLIRTRYLNSKPPTNLEPTPTPNTTEFRDLIKNVLQKDPSKRLTIPQILAHSWFTNHVPAPTTSSRVVSPVPRVVSPVPGHRVASPPVARVGSPPVTSSGETTITTNASPPIHDASGSSVTSESTLYNTSSEFEGSSATSPDDEEEEHEALHLHRNPSQSTIKKWEGGGKATASASVSKKQQPETVEEEEMTPQPGQHSWTQTHRESGNGSHSRSSSRPRSPAINTSINSKEPPLPTRTPVRTKRRSVSSQLSDHEDHGLDSVSPERSHSPHSPTPAEKFALPLPPQDFASLLKTPAPIIFGTELERELLNGLSGLGFDTAQIVHSVLSDACDATGAMWWILKRRAEKRVVEEGGLGALGVLEREKQEQRRRKERKEEGGRRGSVSDKVRKRSDHGHEHGHGHGRGGEDEEGEDTPMAPARIPGTMAAHSAPELAFIPPTPTGPSHQQPSTPPRSRSPNNPFLTPTIPSGATTATATADSLGKSHQSYPSTPAGSVKDKDTKENKEGSKGRREGKARSGSVSIMQRATTALEAAGLVRKRSSEMVKDKDKDKDEKGKGKEEDKRPSTTTTVDESRSSHGSAAGRMLTKSPPLRPVKDTIAIPSTPGMDYGDPMTSSPAVTGSPWVIAGGSAGHGGMSSPDPDLMPTPANSPGDTLTALPNISESGIKSSGHHRNRASLLSAFRMWFNEDRKGKRKAGAGSASGMAYGHGPRTPSSGEHRGTVKMKRRPSAGSARNGHRAKGPSISSHRSSSVNSRRSSTASMHMVVLDSPQYGLDHMVNISRQRSDPSRRSFGSHTPNSERGEYPSSRPSSVQSFSYKHRHRKSPSASSAGSVQHLGRAASPYHRRGGSGGSTRVVRSPTQKLNRPSHARTNSATSSIHSLPSSRPGSFYEPSEGEGAMSMRTASPFRTHSRRSYDESTPRRNAHAHSHGNSTFVAQKRQTPFMPPAVSYSSSGGSVGRTSWKKSWGLEPPGWQTRTASLPIEVLAISPAGEGSSGIRDVFTSRTSLSNPSSGGGVGGGGSGRPGSGGGLLDDESDWVDEDDDVPAFAGGLGQMSSLASGLPVPGLGGSGGGASPLPLDQTFGGYPTMEAPVILSPVPSRGAGAGSRSGSGKRAGKGASGGVGGGGSMGGGVAGGGSSAGASGSRKGHSPIGRISPLPVGSEDGLRHEAPEARGGRRGQLPNNRSGAAFRTIVIQEEDEGEEE